MAIAQRQIPNGSVLNSIRTHDRGVTREKPSCPAGWRKRHLPLQEFGGRALFESSNEAARGSQNARAESFTAPPAPRPFQARALNQGSQILCLGSCRLIGTTFSQPDKLKLSLNVFLGLSDNSARILAPLELALQIWTTGE